MGYEATAVGDRVATLKQARHLNVFPESLVRRFSLGSLTGSAGALLVWLVVFPGRPLLLSAQTLHYANSPNVKNGQKVYNDGCIACHGSEGKGAPMASTVFKRPDTFPSRNASRSDALCRCRRVHTRAAGRSGPVSRSPRSQRRSRPSPAPSSQSGGKPNR
jgi:hypothetical protein